MSKLNLEETFSLLPALENKIKSLRTRKEEKVEFIHKIDRPELTLLSANDFMHISSFNQNNVMSVSDFFYKTFLAVVKNDIEKNLDYMQLYNDFKDFIFNELDKIRDSCAKLAQLTQCSATNFINDFSNGIFNDTNLFTNEFENLIASMAVQNEFYESKEKIYNSLKHKFEIQIESLKKLLRTFNSALVRLVNIDNPPSSLQLANEAIINNGKFLGTPNSIGINPLKSVYVACSFEKGCDMVIKNFVDNIEISRTKVFENCCNYLWSPCGKRILAATEKKGIRVFDEIGKLLFSIENTHNSVCCGASWLSSKEIFLAFEDSVLKIFDLEESKEINRINLIEANSISSVEVYDESSLFAGDSKGVLIKLDYKKLAIEWCASIHQKWINVLKITHDNGRVITGSSDCYVKCLSIKNKSILWKFCMNDFVFGLSVSTEDGFLLALSQNKQLVVLSCVTGTKFLDYTNFNDLCTSLCLEKKTNDIFVGTKKGTIIQLKCIFNNINLLSSSIQKSCVIQNQNKLMFSPKIYLFSQKYKHWHSGTTGNTTIEKYKFDFLVSGSRQ